MENIIFWATVGIFVLFLTIGLICGLVRGWKRALLHIFFMFLSVLIAFFITKTITATILEITITPNGETYTIRNYIISMLEKQFDISKLDSALDFISVLPDAIVSPIIFIALTLVGYLVLDIIYLIVSRIVFGSKKKEFAEKKPYRVNGALIGVFEGFIFLFVLFAPLTALTKTYGQLSYYKETTSQTAVVAMADSSNKLQTIPELLNDFIPKEVNEVVEGYNKSFIGKLTGFGGIAESMFDGLSNIKLDGENINIRKELLNLTSTYNNFAVSYNHFIDKEYDKIDVEALKKQIETFLDNGLFKKVVANTVRDVVVNFDYSSLGLPNEFEEVYLQIKDKFTKEDFSASEYLKHDILLIIDTAVPLLQSDFISDLDNMGTGFVEILNFIDKNSDNVKTAANNLLSLNLVNDSFDALLKLASQKIVAGIENEDNLEISLNTNITDKTTLVDETLSLANQVLELNDLIDITSILANKPIKEILNNVNNFDTTLTKAGEVLDDLRNFELLVHTKEGGEKVYVLDNLLEILDFKVLGDEVYVKITDTEKTTLDTYTKLLSFIKTPLINAREIGLLDFTEVMNFDDVMDKILAKNKDNENFLAETLLPLQQLTVLNINDMFNDLIDTLKENVSILDFDNVENTYVGWKEEFINLGETLNTLNQGDISGKTYIKYILSESSDYEVLLKDIIQTDGKLREILNPVFDGKIFTKLINNVFEQLDTAIGQFTKVTPKTDTTNLNATKDRVITDLEEILKITLSISEEQELSLAQIGNILDILKANAYNDQTDDGVNNGDKNGVFNEVFVNIIWYLTGKDISESEKFVGKEPFKNCDDVNSYLKIDTNEGYYTYESYQQAMKKLDDAIYFAKEMENKLNQIGELSNETVGEFVTAIKDTLTEDMKLSEEVQLETIQTLKDLISENTTREDILTEEEKLSLGSSLNEVIESTELGFSTDVQAALKDLLGVNTNP